MISNSNILTTNSTLKSYKDSGMELIAYCIQRYQQSVVGELFFAFAILFCIAICVKNCFWPYVQRFLGCIVDFCVNKVCFFFFMGV